MAPKPKTPEAAASAAAWDAGMSEALDAQQQEQKDRAALGASSVDAYFAAKDALHKAFGYTEDWHLYNVRDYREHWWCAEKSYSVYFADKPEIVDRILQGREPTEDYYSHVVRTDRFLGRSTWADGHGHTMLLCDTETDGNVILAIFDDAKRRTP
jgi:hypothetical protein